jgi:uncharacterized protein (TIGR00255 family)
MTGHGQATGQFQGVSIQVELRSVNNRYLKVVSRVSDRIATIEPLLENVLRDTVRRGTINVNLRLSGAVSADDFKLDENVLEAYARQAKSIARTLGLLETVSIGELLQLPGVVAETRTVGDQQELIEQVWLVVKAAANSLNEMRRAEGSTMETELLRNLKAIETVRSKIDQRAPQVVEDYRLRLQAKIETLLEKVGVSLNSSDLLREVQIFAERADIREELVRLESHCQLFMKACQANESQGRKLDFLTQEMGREINTIGSKANDAAITEMVVELKTILEQMRELVQNVE